MARGGARKGAGRPRKANLPQPFVHECFAGLDAFVAAVEAENRERFGERQSASERDAANLRRRIERWRRKLKAKTGERE